MAAGTEDEMVSFGIIKRKSPGRLLGTNNHQEELSITRTTSARFEKPRIRRRPNRKFEVFVPFVVSFCMVSALLLVFKLFLALPAQEYHGAVRSRWRAGEEVVHPRVLCLHDTAEQTKIWQELLLFNSYFSTEDPHTVEPMSSPENWEAMEDSREYSRRQPDTFETETCKPMFPWQLMAFPTCNSMHEIDMARASVYPDSASHEHTPVFLTSGYWRDVWVLRNTSLDCKVVLKTTRFMHNITFRNYDRNRRDALVMERLTKSPWVLNVFGFCGTSGLSEYANGGDISAAIWDKSEDEGHNAIRIPSNLSHREQLHIGVQAAVGLSELHNFDKEGQASVAHTDITPGQFVKVEGGRYKLQDFNRARFIRWDAQKQKPCTYNVSSNPGKNRSPEEYAHQPQSEKVDVYSLGNLFYMLLQKEWPFQTDNTKKAQGLVKKGYRPSFFEDIWNSNNLYDKALKEAMLLCHEQDPEKRPSARDVTNYLKRQLEVLDPGVLDSWGEPLAPP